jgi:hypothetical protein
MKYKKYIYIASIILIIFLILYFLPFKYNIQAVNEHNTPINTTISIYWHDYKIWTTYGDTKYFYLPSSNYQIEIEAYGFTKQKYEMRNRLFDYKLSKEEIITMHPKQIDLASFEYYEPTGTVNLSPAFNVTGTTIQGDVIEQTYDNAPIIPFGFYSITAFTPYFIDYIGFEGDVYSNNTSIVYLEPKPENIIISNEDLTYIENFFHDYIELSIANKIDPDFAGYPMQYYLYSNKTVISLGDMFLLFCEKQAYEQSEKDTVYFVLKEKEYSVGGEGTCYSSMLEGNIPEDTGNIFYKKEIPFLLPELNQHNYKIPIGLSYDIESGRYEHNENKNDSISPCKNEIYSLGIDENEIDCEDADYMAWFTPTIGKQTFTEYDYPWVSGIKGFEDLIFLSTEYGIPSTYYMVGKEIVIYEELAPNLIEQTKELVDKDLIEIGTHTYYHTKLGTHSVEFDKEQIELSKNYLEEKFDTKVVGIRGPYFSMIGNEEETNAKALSEIGIEYYSNEWSDYKTKENDAESKPVNTYILTQASPSRLKRMSNWYLYVITVDHPWNLYYDEIEIDGKVYMQENTRISEHYKALVLSAISYGYIPTLVKDIEVK